MSLRFVKLKDCCTIKPPKSEAKKLLNETELVSFVPMANLGINAKDITINEDRALSKVTGSYTYFGDSDVLLAKITPCFENGKLGIAKGLTNKIGFGSSEFIVFRPSKDLLSEYLYYYLLRPSFREQGQKIMTGAVGHKRVPREYIENTEIPLPQIPEQKRIVALLDTVFTDLEQTRAKTEQNLKNARELFDSYLQQVFSQKGEGWEQKKWGDMCKFIRGPFGGSLKKSMFKSEGYAVYEQKHAIHDHIEQLRYYVDEEKFEEMKRFELKAGELIMSCSGVTLGRASVIPEGAPKGIINQALLKLTANDDLDIHFLKYWIRSKIFQDIIFEHAGGAAIPNVPAAKILKEIKLQIPTIEKQKIIVSEIDSMVSKRDSLLRVYTEKLAALDELKKSILQKAFSGELTHD